MYWPNSIMLLSLRDTSSSKPTDIQLLPASSEPTATMRSIMTLYEPSDLQQLSLLTIWINLFAAMSIVLCKTCSLTEIILSPAAVTMVTITYIRSTKDVTCALATKTLGFVKHPSCMLLQQKLKYTTSIIYSIPHILPLREKVTHLFAIRHQLSQYYDFTI